MVEPISNETLRLVEGVLPENPTPDIMPKWSDGMVAALIARIRALEAENATLKATAFDLSFADDALDHARKAFDEGLGITVTFIDDSARLIVGLAQRAILAGLASDAHEESIPLMTATAEKHRAAHEAALGRPIEDVSTWRDKAIRLEAEARMVAHRERERCAKVAEAERNSELCKMHRATARKNDIDEVVYASGVTIAATIADAIRALPSDTMAGA